MHERLARSGINLLVSGLISKHLVETKFVRLDVFGEVDFLLGLVNDNLWSSCAVDRGNVHLARLALLGVERPLAHGDANLRNVVSVVTCAAVHHAAFVILLLLIVDVFTAIIVLVVVLRRRRGLLHLRDRGRARLGRGQLLRRLLLRYGADASVAQRHRCRRLQLLLLLLLRRLIVSQLAGRLRDLRLHGFGSLSGHGRCGQHGSRQHLRGCECEL